jgi:predicted dienelactone hydrolase
MAATAAAQMPAKPPPFHVGLHEIVVPDEFEPAGIHVWLWYPTRVPPEPWRANAYLVNTRTDAVPVPGRKPLVVLSHGSFGYVFGLHHFAEFLASHGYIVATPIHPRDNNADSSGTYTDLQLVGRSRHIARTIDGVLRDPLFGPLIDPQKIGMGGFSAGGYTALTVLGAVPDFARLTEYCQGNPDDGISCSGGLNGKVRIERPDWHQTPDPRVKAAVMMAPGYGFLFSRKTLRAVTRPVLLYRAASDSAIRHPFSEEWIAENLGRKPEYHVVPGDHLIFLSPCAPGITADICSDAPGVDREKIHTEINASMLDFFGRTLH